MIDVEELIQLIINCSYQVRCDLGIGYVEKVYQNALKVLLQECGINVECEIPIAVHYHGQIIGDYRADLLVEKKIIIETKVVK